ncbi:EDD domain protein, DegV family [Halobacteroides halobius DSM 5150]|uniref:EDD domain protein, DegV family n=1 Tax=Halobacteroides halobius (strain ATCC 35273 / DSM 5150 / MD-1) TaxID=748449 RepID=L0K9U9_HALHC|nr:DegV family protein [Halobacteroides halobius]AGB41154.1 EDD domain protein, DegV family [Halobacteroides halobius DSM 5150]
MAKIAVVTDSTADLTSNQLQEYDITRVPLQVMIADQEYQDWVEINPDQFLKKLEVSDHLPTTSQPPVGRFVKVYEELAKEYDHIISLHVSTQLSGTIKAAQLAADMVEEVEIKVIDSETVSISLGIMAIEVAKKVKEGTKLGKIIKFIDRIKEQVGIYFTVDDLDYLEQGGRIGKAAAFLGNLFKVRPLMTVEDGEVAPYKKVRGEKRLYRVFKEVIDGKLDNKKGQKLVILYSKYQDKAKQLEEILTNEFAWREVEVRKLGPVIGSHVGPTAFGAAIYK